LADRSREDLLQPGARLKERHRILDAIALSNRSG
jgi:hypothetical protein